MPFLLSSVAFCCYHLLIMCQPWVNVSPQQKISPHFTASHKRAETLKTWGVKIPTRDALIGVRGGNARKIHNLCWYIAARVAKAVWAVMLEWHKLPPIPNLANKSYKSWWTRKSISNEKPTWRPRSCVRVWTWIPCAPTGLWKANVRAIPSTWPSGVQQPVKHANNDEQTLDQARIIIYNIRGRVSIRIMLK